MTTVSDVLVHRLVVHTDHRGNLRETYRESWFPDAPPVKQMVRSKSEANTMRAMHAHRKQWDIWHFVEGKALVVLYDKRGGLSTVVGTPDVVIAIPPGVAHGFYTEYGCILTYLLTEEYDGSDEYGFDPWDDSFPGRWYWPERDQVKVSERDLNAPPLKTFLAGL